MAQVFPLDQNGRLEHFRPFWSSTLSDSTAATPYNRASVAGPLETLFLAWISIPEGDLQSIQSLAPQQVLNVGAQTWEFEIRRKAAGKRHFPATQLFNVAVQFFACCNAAFGKNDFRTAEKRMLQCNFCSATFRKLQCNFCFHLWHVSRTKNQPKEEVFETDIPRTSGGHSRGYPGPKLRPGQSKSRKSKHFGADIHDPKARTSTTLRGFQKLRSEKLWAEFSFPNVAGVGLRGVGFRTYCYSIFGPLGHCFRIIDVMCKKNKSEGMHVAIGAWSATQRTLPY